MKIDSEPCVDKQEPHKAAVTLRHDIGNTRALWFMILHTPRPPFPHHGRRGFRVGA